MALNPRTRGPRRTLWTFAAIIIALFVLIFSVNRWGTGQLSPKLGLDLEGGTQMVLEPVLADPNAEVSSGQLEKARDIIAQRVDSNGVAEAEVSTQGGRNIVISIPGQPDAKTLDQIRKPSQLRFRAVLVTGSGIPATVTTPTSTATGTQTSEPTATTPKPVFTMDPAPTATSPATSGNAVVPPALVSETSPTAPAATSTPTATAAATPTPANASDLAWITPEIEAEFTALDCTKAGAINDFVDDPAKPLVTCSTDRVEKYILGPVELDGTDIADATSGYQSGNNGQPTNIVEVRLNFTGEGGQKFANVTTRLYALQAADQTRNRFAIVLDKQVISAPSTNAVIANGQASITGNFTIESARSLAQQLKFGALPMSFALQTQDDISPTLGKEQLGLGLLAGLIGLLLVVGYSLFQYRLLGLVTVASLIVAAVLTYGVLTLLGWSHNFRLTMAGVTGVIVAIGVTADSFIVYFERVRDEVREGRPLVTAVDSGWRRARRTILAADGVNLLAATVLYLLAASNVRGFAFTLGVTTLIDLAVVFLFTHPLVSILAHTKFFGGGHPWSGLDPERLGAKTTQPRYAGAGRFTGTPVRTAAAKEAKA
ncbi:MAG TPA: protein translocase subunit SecD [Dermatophilaceae bacterium]|jgi:preprotein translocase subunit SecD|uniref:Protein translocase subunit SecD n=1 Tax=Candidatus Phosphoribacter hodrii TaxID=2953743 RepID=A0A934X415_9MICO|nr:protein translocase subunit SecD [Candidatus Phosphoribacter hodrii]HOA00958.1 protein translocase subunit SecD [Dermatophilaceae bacterium]HPV80064.1 protein translocase subunit SecD [Dermatophilaceae bacterium]